MFVTGASCNGKSTLGRALAERLSVPYTELDALHHGPDWTEASAEELRERVEAAMAASDGWVIDGGYRGEARRPPLGARRHRASGSTSRCTC